MRESLSPCSPSSLALASLEAVAVLLVVDYYSCRPFLHLPLSPTMLSLRALSAFRPCRLTGRWPSLSTSTVQGPLGLLGEDEGEGRGRAARAQACGAVPVVVGSRRGGGPGGVTGVPWMGEEKRDIGAGGDTGEQRPPYHEPFHCSSLFSSWEREETRREASRRDRRRRGRLREV